MIRKFIRKEDVSVGRIIKVKYVLKTCDIKLNLFRVVFNGGLHN